nr:unnamed protein product [Callosobruchus analis]
MGKRRHSVSRDRSHKKSRRLIQMLEIMEKRLANLENGSRRLDSSSSASSDECCSSTESSGASSSILAPPEQAAVSVQRSDASSRDILGRREPEDHQWGPPLHPDVLLRWEPILNSGLSETDVKALILQHLPPENFKAMSALRLNLVIERAISNSHLLRDQKLSVLSSNRSFGKNPESKRAKSLQGSSPCTTFKLQSSSSSTTREPTGEEPLVSHNPDSTQAANSLVQTAEEGNDTPDAIKVRSAGQRVQTLASIDVGNLHILPDRLDIHITKQLKTTHTGRNQTTLVIPFFTEDADICPAKYVLSYLEEIKTIRGNIQNLFVTFKKPHHPASTQTISRWLKATLKLSGVDVNLFGAHSTRHASTSSAARKGVHYDNIRLAAGWTEKSKMFAIFYNKPLTHNRLEFAHSVLLVSSIT